MKLIFLEAVQNFGGARISTLEIASRLAEKHEVLIIDFYGSCAPFVKNVRERKLPFSIIDPRQEPFIISGSTNPLKNFVNKFKFVPHWIIMRKKILKAIEDFNADYVLVNNYKTLSILYGNRRRDFKIMFFARGWFVPHQISSTKKFFLKNTVDKYICVAEATRHALYCGKFADLRDLYVVHNAIDEGTLSKETIELKGASDETVILHAAGFLPEKGQLVAIEIAERLKAEGLEFKLVLAGLVYKGERSKHFYETIQRIIVERALDDVITIVANQTNVIPYFRGANIIIHPSETEGLPRVVMEAMCLKKPVIANAVGGVTDFILNGYTGFVTDYNNVDDYCYYIHQLVNNPDLYAQISENAYSLVTKCFNPRNQAVSFEKLLKK